MKRRDSSSAPAPSMQKVPIRACCTIRTTPSMSFRFKVDTITSRSDSPMRRCRAKENRVMTVMKPSPPNWIITRMTVCPNRLHWSQVSATMRPVTQEAEVAVNRLANSPAL